ncbi:L-tyrosine 3-hydroxylase [Amycolatopsis sp. NPDC049868]|uniref:L-tyrosine 3-hydroxylase n=1 Tax=Amycolatopsis sp. NPDC049868 TaxID=3363934 RepID=UPI00378C7AED
MVTAAAPVTPVRNLGLTTLLLPMPEAPFGDCCGCGGPALKEVQAAPPVADVNAGALYRWLLGHHGAFCVWRLTSEVISAGEHGQRGALNTVAALVDTYSALLLYAGSCSPHVYGTVLRTAMIAMNPAFSGTWARDYEHISARLRQLERSSDSASLKEALRFNRVVHATIAVRMVPSGRSLLREAGRTKNQTPTDEERDVLDSFFLTARGAMCRRGFLAQLQQRSRLVVEDIRGRPLDVQYDREPLNQFQSRVEEHLDRATAIAEAILR